MKLEITEVERLSLKPGDVLFVHPAERLTDQGAALVRDRIAAIIDRPDVKIVVLAQGMTVKVGDGL